MFASKVCFSVTSAFSHSFTLSQLTNQLLFKIFSFMRNRNAIYFYATFLKIIKWTRFFPRLQGFSAPEKLQTFILLSCSNLSQWEASFLGRMKKIAISLGFTQHCLKNFVKFFILPIQLFKISFVLAKTALPHFFQNLIALPCCFFSGTQAFLIGENCSLEYYLDFEGAVLCPQQRRN